MADGNMTMTYSAIVPDKSGRKIVRIKFERNGKNGPEIAEGLLPDCKIISQNGYSAEEVTGLEEYLKGNLDDFMSKAKVISNPLKWL
ncbi:hypothetical protein [Butyrivibrio sp. VCB2006]|uniref:hypothetical protein n=1 Tax=Butyrivibrio sp. VCB2006 TaxID=1280679 RepID=UPI0003F8F554|nr:hypothetical protein [Butyrivibrio sp. VCB2006]